MKAREIVMMREQHREMVGAMGQRSLPLLEYLYQSPVINVRRLAQELGIPYSTLNKTVAAFEDAGLLVNTSKTQRNRIYTYKQYLDLFQEM